MQGGEQDACKNEQGKLFCKRSLEILIAMIENKADPNLLRILGIIKNKQFVGPESVMVDLAKNCNLNCLFCPYHSFFRKKKKEKLTDILPIGVVKNFLNDCHKLDVKTIHIVSAGEPFLYPKIDEVINFAFEKGLKIFMNTNGIFEGDKIKLAPKVKFFNFNLNAASKETYEILQDVKKRGYFYKAVKNIKKIDRLRKRHGLKMILEVNYIVNKYNYREIEDFIALGKKIGIDRIYLRVMSRNAHNKSLILGREDVIKFRAILKKMLENAPDVPVMNIREMYNIFGDTSFLKSGQNRKKYKEESCRVDHCYMGWLGSYVDVNGDVYVCCRRQAKKERIGNIRKQRFFDIWNSEKFEILRKKYKEDIDTRKGEWKTCRVCWNHGLNKSVGERIERWNK
jgi:radical SAM protein with 4Fe4S-binding SPASM domain